MQCEVSILPGRREGRGDLPDRDALELAAGDTAMSENEKEIVAINGAARERGLSYGQFVSRASEEELREAIVKHWAREKKGKQ